MIRLSSGEKDEFDRVIVTVGPWMSSLLKHVDLPLRTTRQQIVYLNIVDHQEYFDSNGIFPVWIDATENLYGFPSDGQINGVKLAYHHCGEIIVDLDGDRAAVDEDYKQSICDYAKRRFPYLGSNITYSQTCMWWICSCTSPPSRTSD